MSNVLECLRTRALNTLNGLDHIDDSAEKYFLCLFRDESGNHVTCVAVDAVKCEARNLRVSLSKRRDLQSQYDAVARAATFMRDMDHTRKVALSRV